MDSRDEAVASKLVTPMPLLLPYQVIFSFHKQFVFLLPVRPAELHVFSPLVSLKVSLVPSPCLSGGVRPCVTEPARLGPLGLLVVFFRSFSL